MKTLSNKAEIVEAHRIGDETYEIWASIVATHNENTGELTLTLDSFVRDISPSGASHDYRPDWLPEASEQRHSAEVEDAWEEAGLVFDEWIDSVKRYVPDPAQFLRSLEGALASVPVSETPLIHRSAFRREV